MPRISRSPPPGRSRRSEVELTIERLGHRGDGVGRHGGRPVYIPLTAPGDRVRATLGDPVGDGVAGRLLELVADGDGRAEPPCPHFGACGGCLLQHLTAAHQARWKGDLIRDALRRRGIQEAPMAPIATSPPHSRRRVALTARRSRRSTFVGFNERHSRRIVDLDRCPVSRPEIVALLPALRRLLSDLLPESAGIDVVVTLLDDGLDVVLVGGPAPDLAARQRLAAFADAEDLARLSWRAAPERPVEPIAHRRPGTVRFGGVPVILPPGGFLQATAAGEAALVAVALAAAEGAAPVADLFAGSGAVALPLARRGRVLAVDSDGDALAALNRAGRQAGLGPAVETLVRDLHREPLTAAELAPFAVVVFDPPRAGARDQAAALAASTVPVVVAISCAPTSFARDARLLVDGGYRLQSLTPVDQFLWSPHVELAAVFRR